MFVNCEDPKSDDPDSNKSTRIRRDVEVVDIFAYEDPDSDDPDSDKSIQDQMVTDGYKFTRIRREVEVAAIYGCVFCRAIVSGDRGYSKKDVENEDEKVEEDETRRDEGGSSGEDEDRGGGSGSGENEEDSDDSDDDRIGERMSDTRYAPERERSALRVRRATAAGARCAR